MTPNNDDHMVEKDTPVVSIAKKKNYYYKRWMIEDKNVRIGFFFKGSSFKEWIL